MLWALGQPAAAVGLVGAFLVGLGLRALAQRALAGPPDVSSRPRPRTDVEPLGAVAVLLGGTGWGRGVARPRLVEVAAGPVAVLAASLVGLAAFCFADPADREALRLNHPSDVLRGVVAPTMGRS